MTTKDATFINQKKGVSEKLKQTTPLLKSFHKNCISKANHNFDWFGSSRFPQNPDGVSLKIAQLEESKGRNEERRLY